MRSKVLLFTGIFLWISGAWSLRSDDRPGLPELQQFTTKDGNSLNLLQDIGINYEGFGTCILNDEGGTKMNIIRSNHRTVESMMRDIFTQWLQGKGKRPETWAIVVSCLRHVSLNYLGDIIEKEYTDSGTTGTSTKPSTTGSGDEIKKFTDLIQAVSEIGNWRALCMNLDVGQDVLDPLIHSTDVVDTKKTECLRAYFDGGEPKWSDVIKAIEMHPIKNKRVANRIRKEYGNESKREEL